MSRARRTNRLRATAVFGTALVLAAGCGGDGDGDLSKADRAAATRFLLTADDLPGFTKVPRPSNWPPVYAACGDDPLLPGSGSPDPEPTSFLRDDTARLRKLQVDGVESYAVVAASEADAERTMGLVTDGGFRECVRKGLGVAQEETVENEQVVGSSLLELATPVLGDAATAFRVTVDEGEHHIDHELTVIRKGRALAFLFTGRLGPDSYPDDERQRLAAAMAARMP